GRRKELVLGGDDATGKIAGNVEHAGTPGAQQRIGHLARDTVEAVRQNGQPHSIDTCRFPVHLRHLLSPVCKRQATGPASIDRLPDGRRVALAPGSSTTVVKADSTKAGPATVSPTVIDSKCSTGTSANPPGAKYARRLVRALPPPARCANDAPVCWRILQLIVAFQPTTSTADSGSLTANTS